jgi:microcin C transport system permease protein
MYAYIIRRLILMIPTLIGVLTITYIVSEFVPGGPLDQIQAMLEDRAGPGAGGEVAVTGQGGPDLKQRYDPKLEEKLKRIYGLHVGRFERYLRTLIWFSPDSITSSAELDGGDTQKFVSRNRNYIVLRLEDEYFAFRNSWSVAGDDGEVVFDGETGTWKSVLDGTRFDARSGKAVKGPAGSRLEPLPLQVRSERGRDEVYIKQSVGAALLNPDNWHGFFLLRFGKSINKNKTVVELIKERLPVSVSLGFWSFIITYPVCILLGIAKAVRNGTRFDSVTSAVVLLGYSIPGFVLAVLLIVLFGPGEGHLVELIPISGLTSEGEPGYESLSAAGRVLDYLHHLIAPILCLSIGSFAVLTMLTKNSLLEEIHQLYAVAARARGLSKRKVLYKHVLRNSLIPLVTGFPSTFLFLFLTGSLLIEKIFSLNGLGLLSYTAVMERDFPVIMGSLFIFTVLGLIGRLLTDICYVIVDPRISFEGGQS